MAISLIDAIRQGDLELAKHILIHRKYKEIDSQYSRKDGTALYWASCLGILDIVRLLVLHGADVNSETSWKSTPLHAACDNNHCDIVRYLIKCGANVNETTQNGNTPCHLAAYRGFAEIVQILVENGASTHVYNDKYKTVMEEAKNNGHEKIVEYITAVRRLVQGNSNLHGPVGKTTVLLFPPLENITQNTQSNLINDTEEYRCLQYNDNENDCFGVNSLNDLSLTSNKNYQSKMSFKNI
ncbi:hypothetical protein KUTeg_020149 [Tegillarca granosa]|uniref:Uncharacterized protein n=1 Tax=Tegillarca granosa TaxID=220873 RepID=A0ABQ9E774_TEGGR|nr:hypothetical protein KUTeg_020149 [Tegillarca granosa]